MIVLRPADGFSGTPVALSIPLRAPAGPRTPLGTFEGRRLRSQEFEEAGEAGLGFDAARLAPRHELGHVHPSIGGLAVVDPGLGLAQEVSEVSLREARILPHLSEEGREGFVPPRVLGLG